MSKQEFYKNGDQYVALTGESPKGLPMLVIAWVGESPENITQECLNVKDVQAMEKIDPSQLNEGWVNAFTRAGLKFPKPTPVKRKRRKQKQPNYELFHGHLAAGTDVFTAAVDADIDFSDDPPGEDLEPVPISDATLVTIIVLTWIVSGFIIGIMI